MLENLLHYMLTAQHTVLCWIAKATQVIFRVPCQVLSISLHTLVNVPVISNSVGRSPFRIMSRNLRVRTFDVVVTQFFFNEFLGERLFLCHLEVFTK
jgi:hypothetical protein